MPARGTFGPCLRDPCHLNVATDKSPVKPIEHHNPHLVSVPTGPPKATDTSNSPKQPDLLDTILDGTVKYVVDEPIRALTVVEPHPLDGIDEVEAAARVIGELLVEDRIGKGIRVYPRRILRQQHIAAYMLVNPFATTTEVCAFFGIGPSALSNICKSDTFKALVSQHRITLEHNILGDLQEQLRTTLAASIDVIQDAIVRDKDPDFALAVLDKTANRLGMGAKHNTNVQINNNIVTPEMIANARARRVSGGS